MIIGAGAAGLATAIFAGRVGRRSILLLDAARRPGAKILVSGGGRCNVTNAHVSELDFEGGRRSIVRRVLRGYSAAQAVDFFQRLGVPLHEEADGKMFPDSNRARDVLTALLNEAARLDATLLADHRVRDVQRTPEGFRVVTGHGDVGARAVVLAAGGQSLPKSGSDGSGFELARRLGHTIVPPAPALVPLLLEGGGDALHREVAGVSHAVELTARVDGRRVARVAGSMLWTHFGISGPAVLNISRHWTRATLERRPASLTASFYPAQSFEMLDAAWTDAARDRPKATVQHTLAVPSSVAAALLRRLSIDPSTPLAHFRRELRRGLIHAVLEWPLPVADARGYNYAEATAGGVALDEIDPATMESRVCRGLYVVGEVLDVDGRIGGFNFQWAWSSAHVAAAALARS